MRKDHQGMLIFLTGMFVTMSAVGGMEHQPDHLVSQVIAALVGLAVMYWGVIKIRDAE